MARYIKRPIEIEAVRVIDLLRPGDYGGYDLPQWVRDAMNNGTITSDGISDFMNVLTPEGVMVAGPDSYIVRGAHGEIYPVRGDIFRDTYDLVGERWLS